MGMYKYAGFGDRIFDEDDFKRHGVEDQGAVRFDDDNNHVAELSDAAAKFLMEQHNEPLEPVQADGSPYPAEDSAAEAAQMAEGATAEDQATTGATNEPSAPAGDTAAGAASTKSSTTRAKAKG